MAAADRIERMLAIAEHASTPIEEAKTALRGARKVALSSPDDLEALARRYGDRFASVQHALDLRENPRPTRPARPEPAPTASRAARANVVGPDGRARPRRAPTGPTAAAFQAAKMAAEDWNRVMEDLAEQLAGDDFGSWASGEGPQRG